MWEETPNTNRSFWIFFCEKCKRGIDKLEHIKISWSALEHILCIAIPIFLALLFDVPEKYYIEETNKVFVYIVITILYLIMSIDMYLRDRRERKEAFDHRSSRYAFSIATALAERKRDRLVKSVYENPEHHIAKKDVPYDVHEHIAEICREFKDLIAQITEISTEYMSVSFIYKYCSSEESSEEPQWRWLTGRELSGTIDLQEFVKKKDTVFHYIINGNANYVYADRKEELLDRYEGRNHHYHFSLRDNMHRNIGSIFSVRIKFSCNDGKEYVDSILTVASYGKIFSHKRDKVSLRSIILEEILPYYQRCLEIELGYLYLRHQEATERSDNG